MIGLAIFLSYVVVSAFTARATLRAIMARPVCVEHREGWFTGKCFSNWHTEGKRDLWDDGRRRTVPFGELAERPPPIAIAALGFGFIWPITLMFLFVLHAPPTPDEMARRNADMADRIKHLEEELRRPS